MLLLLLVLLLLYCIVGRLFTWLPNLEREIQLNCHLPFAVSLFIRPVIEMKNNFNRHPLAKQTLSAVRCPLSAAFGPFAHNSINYILDSRNCSHRTPWHFMALLHILPRNSSLLPSRNSIGLGVSGLLANLPSE